MQGKGWDMSEDARSHKWYYSFLPVGIANGATSLLIPLFAKEIGASLAQIGMIAAASSLASVPAFMLWGALSDRLGRRKLFVILGFLGMALCLFLMGLSQGVPDYFLSNILVGLLSTASAPVATVLLIETAEKEQWAKRLAFFSQIGGIGWVAGLALGAVWMPLTITGIAHSEMMRALFIIGSALSVLSAFTAWIWIKEPKTGSRPRPMHIQEHHFITVERLKYMPMRMLHFFNFKTYLKGEHRFTSSLNVYLISIFLLFAGFTAFFAFFPIFLVDEFGMNSSEIFVIYIAAQLTSVISYARVGAWVQTKGSKRMQLLGCGLRVFLFPSIFLVSLLGLPAAGNLVLVFVIHALIGLCWAIINVSGSMIISGLSPPAVQGHSFGAYNAMQGFGSIAGPIAGGMICQYFGYASGFAAASIFIVMGMAVLLRIRISSGASTAPN